MEEQQKAGLLLYDGAHILPDQQCLIFPPDHKDIGQEGEGINETMLGRREDEMMLLVQKDFKDISQEGEHIDKTLLISNISSSSVCSLS